ncbi:MAG: cation transporter [Clostridia bacterium]|nr:cation transporter [Clostridia bacterium]
MNFLKKLCVRDYKNTEDEIVRTRYGIVAGIFGIITNFILFVGKISVGFLAGSITIVADAVNNFFDFVSSNLLVYGFKYCLKPADRTHPFGHERIEQVMALIISVIVFGVGLFFFEKSIERLINPDEVKVSTVTFVFLGSAVVIKFFQMLLYKDFAKSIKSDTLRASAMDSRNDVISSSVVLFAMIFIKVFGNVGVSVDGLFGLILSVLVILSSIKLIKEMISPLLGEMPKKEFIDNIKKEILAFDCVLGVYNFVLHSYGAKKYFASVDVEVNVKNDTLRISQEMYIIEKKFKNDFNINLTIHVEFVDIDDENNKFLRKKILVILKNIDEDFYIHDFDVVKDKNCAKIRFDLVAPFEKDVDLQFIYNQLNEKCVVENCKFDINLEKG